MFGEKSGKILKNISTKTEMKNKITNWGIRIKIDTLWALKSGHCFKQITNLKIAKYFLKKWDSTVAVKKWKKIVCTKMMLEKNVCGAETYMFKKIFPETYMFKKYVCGDVYV